LTVPLEILRRQIAQQPTRPDELCETISHSATILERAKRNLTGLEFLALEREVVVAHVLDGWTIRRYSLTGFPTCMKVCGSSHVMLKGNLRIGPNAKEANPAPDLLAPLAVVVRGQGK
jgi:hypothetical protein